MFRDQIGKATPSNWTFLANGIDEPSKKKAILLANVPGETFQLVKELLAPKKSTDGTFMYGVLVN